MWKVEISEYSYRSHDYATYREYFNSMESALDYCKSLQLINADIIIEDMSPIDGDEYTDGEIIWVQRASL